MREFEFRIWEKKYKEMNYSPFSVWSGYCLMDGALKEVNGPSGSEYTDDTEDVLMQYTGMNDRDGKYIYEGDIVSQRFMEFMPQHFNEDLKFNQGNIIGEVIYARDCYRIKDSTNETLHEITSTCVVIGNIYQNKRLLNEQRD